MLSFARWDEIGGTSAHARIQHRRSKQPNQNHDQQDSSYKINQGYHYNRNAETCMEVGNALGWAMAELLKEQT